MERMNTSTGSTRKDNAIYLLSQYDEDEDE